MNSTLAKRPASFLRAQTQLVRDHGGAMARLMDQYVAKLARAQADYVDGVKRLNAAILTEEQDNHEQDSTATPTAESQVAAE